MTEPNDRRRRRKGLLCQPLDTTFARLLRMLCNPCDNPFFRLTRGSLIFLNPDQYILHVVPHFRALFFLFSLLIASLYFVKHFCQFICFIMKFCFIF